MSRVLVVGSRGLGRALAMILLAEMPRVELIDAEEAVLKELAGKLAVRTRLPEMGDMPIRRLPSNLRSQQPWYRRQRNGKPARY